MSLKILEGETITNRIDCKSLGQILFENCEKYKDRICHIDASTDKSNTYGDVHIRSIRVALELVKRGISSEDTIAFCSNYTLECIIPVLAAFYLGAKVVNFDPQFSIKHMQHLLPLVKPKIIFVEENCLELIEKSLTNFTPEIIIYGKSNKYQTFNELLKPEVNEENFLPKNVSLDCVALFLFTSGEAGLPKMVCHTYRSLCYMVASQRHWEGYNLDVILCTRSLSWVVEACFLISCFIDGGRRILTNDLNPENILYLIEKHQVTTIFLMPPFSYALKNSKNMKNYDVSSLLMIHIGGSILNRNQLQIFSTFFDQSKFHVAYGMSEIGPITGFPPKQGYQLMVAKPNSIGRLFPGVSAKVVDITTGNLLGVNEKGEIQVKSISLMQGYYKSDNSQVFDEDGFLKTGDIGYYDEDGYFYIVDKIRDVIKCKDAYQIMPSSIEVILMEHPAVKEAIVIGIPGDEQCELPAACIVLKEGFSATEAEIDAFVSARVSIRERLRGGITFVECLQKTYNGKLMRKEIKELMLPLFRTA